MTPDRESADCTAATFEGNRRSPCWSTSLRLSGPRLWARPSPGVLSCALPPAQPQLLKVIGSVGEHREGGRPLPPDTSPGNRRFPGIRKPRELPPCFRVCAGQGGEARQGPRQGELPTSLTASLIGSLCLSVTMSQPEWFVPECIFSVHDLVPSPLTGAGHLALESGVERLRGEHRPRGSTPTTVQATAHYPGGLPG
jgi:hypothetical protein